MCGEDQLAEHSRKNNDDGLYDERHGYVTLRINGGAGTGGTEQ